MTDYSEMKATKVSKTEQVKDALDSITEKISKSSGSNTRKRSSSKSSSSSSKSNSTKKSSTSKSSSTKKSSTSSSSSNTGTKRKYTKRKKPETITEKIADKITDSIKDFGSPPPKKPNNKKSGSSSNNNPGKNVKKVRMGIILTFVLIFLVIGAVGGFFGTRILTKNDVYEMVCFENGKVDVVIGTHEDADYTQYIEKGVKCVSFGKEYSFNDNPSENDPSKECTVTYYYRNDLSNDPVKVDKVDPLVEGMYYAVYTTPSKKYSTVKFIRNITVLRSEDNEIL